MIATLAAMTGRLPSEWEREEPAAVATVIEVLGEIREQQKP